MNPVESSRSSNVGKPASILDGYRPGAGDWDEVVDASGNIRAGWRDLTGMIGSMGMDDFRRRSLQIHRIVQENDITFNPLGGGETHGRPWVMDPLPMLIGHSEWSAIEKGLSQRVNLLNRILADIYGPQRLLRSGRIPHSLIHGNPCFLRPCHGFQPQNGIFIHIYAADIAHMGNGRWCVLDDRVEVPSGIGYAVENRFITQQVMQDLFRAAGPMRLKPFFERMLESFETLVRRRTEDPCIVMLSPGPGFETYFEQAFFTRNLGYPLVEGADLTTRDNKVYLKTVDGLRQVDVILRNVYSPDCDPLELRPDCALGVPGLVQAALSGNVVMANSLGTGVVESPAMPAFLDDLCRHILNEDLMIPSAATQWCGSSDDMDGLLKRIPESVVKPVFRRHSSEAFFGPMLSASRLESLQAKVRNDPGAFCVQELVQRTTLPSMAGPGAAQPKPFIMRVFFVARGDGYEMMPGALTRVSMNRNIYGAAMEEGGVSKDTWMIAPPDMPQKDYPLPHTGPVRIRRSTAELTSREADNLFWMGRYLERSDYLTRLLRVLVTDLGESSGRLVPPFLIPFVNTAIGETPGSPEAEATGEMDILSAERTLESMIWDKGAAAGISSCLRSLHGTSSAVKERLSLDAVHIISQLNHFAVTPPPDGAGRAPAQRLNSIGMLLSGVSGSMAENMTRAVDWRFLDIGRRIERTLNILDLLQHVFVGPGTVTAAMLSSLLVCADSRYTYASRYLTNIQVESVVDLLLLDPTNPRSVAFQTAIIAEHVRNMPVAGSEEPQTRRRRLALGIQSEIELADVRELVLSGGDDTFDGLTSMLSRIYSRLLQLSDQLALHYFSHSDKQTLFSRSY